MIAAIILATVCVLAAALSVYDVLRIHRHSLIFEIGLTNDNQTLIEGYVHRLENDLKWSSSYIDAHGKRLERVEAAAGVEVPQSEKVLY